MVEKSRYPKAALRLYTAATVMIAGGVYMLGGGIGGALLAAGVSLTLAAVAALLWWDAERW